MSGFASRKTDGTTQESVRKAINPLKCRGTVWNYESTSENISLQEYLGLTIKDLEELKERLNNKNDIDVIEEVQKLETKLKTFEDFLADRGTIWNYLMAGDKDPIKRRHPAHFPDKIPIEFIQTFCPPDGIVLDPFVGSGSSSYAAKKLRRHFIGFDISEEYCKIAEERLNTLEPTLI